MIFKAIGDKSKPAILFFHAMGVTGDSSMPVAKCLEKNNFESSETAYLSVFFNS